jgi:DNA-binding CsgD family transcriptional regulator
VAELWPLVGRSAELDLLCEFVTHGAGVVIAGPAGVGKTRLLAEIVAALPTADWHVERVSGTPAASAFPLASFAFLDESVRREADESGSPLAAARHDLVSRANGRRFVLLVDDTHNLDAASAALVYQLAISGDAIVVASIRTPDAVPDAIVSLWKDERCERVELQPLGRSEVGTLLEQVLGGKVDPESRLAFWEATRGNLLFLRELVRDGLRRGALREDGVWRWSRPADPPASVRDLIGRQVQRLSDDARRALELVALAEPIEWETLVDLAGDAVADSLVGGGELVAVRDGRRLFARFSHPLVGDVVRAAMAEPRRRRLLRTLAATVEGRSRRRPDQLRRVTWLLDADADVDARELVGAARAVALLDTALAERLARSAQARGGGNDAVVVLAQILMFTRRAAEVDAVLAEALEQELSLDDRVALTTMRANNTSFGLSDPVRSIQILDSLAGLVEGDPRRGRAVRSHRLTMMLFAGRVAELLEEYESFLAADPSPPERVRVLLAVIPALAASGRVVAAIELAAGARKFIPAALGELPYAMGQLAAGAILALHWSGRLDDADALAQMGYDAGAQQHAQLLRGISAFHLGLGAYWRGTMQSAERLFEEAVAALGHVDAGFLPSACDHLLAVRSMLGAPDAPDARSADDLRLPLYETERLRLRGVVAAGRGDFAVACSFSDAAARAARASALEMHVVFACWDRARHGRAAEVVDDITAAARACEGQLAPLLARAVHALNESDADGLEAAAEELEQLGFLLWAAELTRSAARACGAAALFARATAAENRATALLARCEGASTWLSRADAGHVGPALTRREREVAELAAAGASNATIADRLAISVRTVETHLQHVYEKLGIGSRADLAGAFGR